MLFTRFGPLGVDKVPAGAVDRSVGFSTSGHRVASAANLKMSDVFQKQRGAMVNDANLAQIPGPMELIGRREPV